MDSQKGHFIAGMMSGGCASLITQPFEVVKTMMLINPSKNALIERGDIVVSLKEGFKEVYK